MSLFRCLSSPIRSVPRDDAPSTQPASLRFDSERAVAAGGVLGVACAQEPSNRTSPTSPKKKCCPIPPTCPCLRCGAAQAHLPAPIPCGWWARCRLAARRSPRPRSTTSLCRWVPTAVSVPRSTPLVGSTSCPPASKMLAVSGPSTAVHSSLARSTSPIPSSWMACGWWWALTCSTTTGPTSTTWPESPSWCSPIRRFSTTCSCASMRALPWSRHRHRTAGRRRPGAGRWRAAAVVDRNLGRPVCQRRGGLFLDLHVGHRIPLASWCSRSTSPLTATSHTAVRAGCHRRAGAGRLIPDFGPLAEWIQGTLDGSPPSPKKPGRAAAGCRPPGGRDLV